MEQSRAAAEGYRHEAEQALIVRTAELDQLATRRDADLVEREEQIAGERAAMRAEANRVKAEALNEATRRKRACRRPDGRPRIEGRSNCNGNPRLSGSVAASAVVARSGPRSPAPRRSRAARRR